MKIRQFMCLCLVLLGAVGCQSAPESITTKTPEPVLTSNTTPLQPSPATSALDQTVIEPAIRIANDSGVPEALKIADWLKAHAAPAIADSASGSDVSFKIPAQFAGRKLPVIEAGPNEPSDFIRAWVSEDKARGQFVVIDGVPPFILLRGESRNVFDLGLLVLHEGWHAKRWMEEGLPKKQHNAPFEEVLIREIEIKVRKAIGGQAYAAVIEKERKRQLAYPKFGITDNGRGGIRFDAEPPLQYRAELEAIFGPCANESDAWKRGWAVWNQVIYGEIEKRFPKDEWSSVKATCYVAIEQPKFND